VFLLGARQVGKSTLARQIATGDHSATIVDLDDPAPRNAALDDPVGFIAGLERPVFIDEIQRGGPDLVLAIKSVVDRDMSPGQFLLTGSANLLRSPRVLDALTGRAAIVTLWPLAQSEIEGSVSNFVDALFATEPPRIAGAAVGREALRDRIASGGYPEARLRSSRPRSQWFEGYLRMTIERDLESIADAHPRLATWARTTLGASFKGIFGRQRLAPAFARSQRRAASG
jgi:predicted AAA+ superfamily ATPase